MGIAKLLLMKGEKIMKKALSERKFNFDITYKDFMGNIMTYTKSACDVIEARKSHWENNANTSIIQVELVGTIN